MAKNDLSKRLDLLEKGRKSGDLYGRLFNKDSGSSKKKKKKPKISDKGYYLITLNNFQISLHQLVCEVNGIDPDYYLFVSGDTATLRRNLKMNDAFFRLSQLKWDEPAPIDGLMFRGRFITYFLVMIIRKTSDIIDGVYENLGGENYKWKTKREILDEWIETVNTFVFSYLTEGMQYEPSLIKIEEIMLAAQDKSYHVEKFVKETESLLLKRDNPETPGYEANNLTKMAYMLSTESTKFKRCPGYDKRYNYHDLSKTLDQVGGLGYAILRYRKKEAKLPPIYKCFQQANPKIISRFYEFNEEAPEVTVGLRALEYSKMFYGKLIRDKRLIEKIM